MHREEREGEGRNNSQSTLRFYWIYALFYLYIFVVLARKIICIHAERRREHRVVSFLREPDQQISLHANLFGYLRAWTAAIYIKTRYITTDSEKPIAILYHCRLSRDPRETAAFPRISMYRDRNAEKTICLSRRASKRETVRNWTFASKYLIDANDSDRYWSVEKINRISNFHLISHVSSSESYVTCIYHHYC